MIALFDWDILFLDGILFGFSSFLLHLHCFLRVGGALYSSRMIHLIELLNGVAQFDSAVFVGVVC